MLTPVITIVGIVGSYFFSVGFQHVTSRLLRGRADAAGRAVTEVIIAFVKATIFGVIAGLIACYKGITVGGGPQGVGNAVNETVVYTFMALFVINVVSRPQSR